MAKQPRSRAFNRILVALDSTRAGQSALESAALLAEAMQYELVGLFVEDADLMMLASLPFSREVRRTGVIRNLDPAILQKEVEAHAAAARYALRDVALRRRLRWSFRSVRGDVGAEFSAAAAEVDIVCISGRSTDRYRRVPMGSPLRVALERQAPVLVAGDLTDRIDKPVGLIVDQAKGVDESIRLAGQIAAKAKTGLVVLEFLPLEADIAALRERIDKELPNGVTARYVLVSREDPCGLLDGLHRNDYSLVLYGVRAETPAPAWLDYVVNAGECPLLLVPEANTADRD
jgi:nucleotide-binding universal stress UspA family protein